MLHTVVVAIAVVAIVIYVIGRQLLGEPIRVKRYVLLPLVLTVIGVVAMTKYDAHPVMAKDAAFIVAGAVLAVVIGVGQGALTRLERRDGALWGTMPVRSLWLWVGFIGLRLLLALGAHVAGAHLAASTSTLLFTLGLNRVAQAAVITARGFRAGIPFAAEQGAGLLGGSLTGGRRGGPARAGGAPAGARMTEPAPQTFRPAPPSPATSPRPGRSNGPEASAQSDEQARSQPQKSWEETGRDIASALGDALGNRRANRRTRGRRGSRRDGW